MTGLERMLRTLKGEAVDRIPVALHNYLMAANMMGIPLDEYCKSGELLAQAQINAWEVFGHDVLMVENGVTAMAEAIGCKVACSPNQPPHVSQCTLKSLDDIGKLKRPIPAESPSLRELLKAVRLIKKHVGDKAFVMGRADQGPMALAAAIYGPERLIIDIATGKNLDKVHALLDFCTNCTMSLASEIHKAGADGTCIGGYGISMISPNIFKKYELLYEKMFVEHCHNENFLTGIHICGHEDPILEDLVSTGADWVELDPLTTPSQVAKTTKDRCAVLGMIDPAGVLLTGTPDDVRAECAERLAQLDSTRFILGPGCALPPDTPTANVAALISAPGFRLQ